MISIRHRGGDKSIEIREGQLWIITDVLFYALHIVSETRAEMAFNAEFVEEFSEFF